MENGGYGTNLLLYSQLAPYPVIKILFVVFVWKLSNWYHQLCGVKTDLKVRKPGFETRPRGRDLAGRSKWYPYFWSQKELLSLLLSVQWKKMPNKLKNDDGVQNNTIEYLSNELLENNITNTICFDVFHPLLFAGLSKKNLHIWVTTSRWEISEANTSLFRLRFLLMF